MIQVRSTVYPIDYDKNNPAATINDFFQHIYEATDPAKDFPKTEEQQIAAIYGQEFSELCTGVDQAFDQIKNMLKQ